MSLILNCEYYDHIMLYSTWKKFQDGILFTIFYDLYVKFNLKSCLLFNL